MFMHSLWLSQVRTQTCELAGPLVAVGRQLRWGAPPLWHPCPRRRVDWRHKVLRAAGARRAARSHGAAAKDVASLKQQWHASMRDIGSRQQLLAGHLAVQLRHGRPLRQVGGVREDVLPL